MSYLLLFWQPPSCKHHLVMLIINRFQGEVVYFFTLSDSIFLVFNTAPRWTQSWGIYPCQLDARICPIYFKRNWRINSHQCSDRRSGRSSTILLVPTYNFFKLSYVWFRIIVIGMVCEHYHHFIPLSYLIWKRLRFVWKVLCHHNHIWKKQ